MSEEVSIKKIKKMDNGALIGYIRIPNYKNFEKYEKNGILRAYLEIKDKRAHSKIQLRKYWALIGDIEFYTGYPKLQLSDTFKITYSELYGLDPSEISLSKIDMNSLYELINLVLDWCMTYDIPLSEDTGLLFRNLEKFYYYLAHKKLCFICGGQHEKKARHTHHIDKIKMGHDRNKVIHLGRKILILCGAHHDEYHMIGHNKFMSKYHIQMITLDESLIKTLKIKEG